MADRLPLFARLRGAFDWSCGGSVADIAADYEDWATDRLLVAAVADPAMAAMLDRLMQLPDARRDRLMRDPRLLHAAHTGDAAAFARLLPAPPHGDRLGQAGIALVAEAPCDAAAYALIGDAAALLAERIPPAWRFVSDFTGLVVVRSDHRPFYSSSPERMIGASILWNLADPGVTVELVAEALVHEAVHSLLDMDAALRAAGALPGGRWMPTALLGDGRSVTLSPWTGAPLSLSIFIHACVVWYALFALWRDLLDQGAGFDREEGVRLLRRATSGFFARPEDQLARFADTLAPDLLPGIAGLGNTVRRALAEAA